MYVVVVLLAVALSSVLGLDLVPVEEGSCKGINYKVADNINGTWLLETEFPYVVAGSKYHLYRMVSNAENEAAPEDLFYYEGCVIGNTKVPKMDVGVVYAFGKEANEFSVKPFAPGIIDFTETQGFRPASDTSRHYISFTDNKSFLVFVNCWLGSDQRSWNVVSTTPKLDSADRALIENQLVSLGFDRKYFAFLRYDHCGLPVPDYLKGNGTLEKIK